jgi:DNA-3-methyladenine glycosylase II
MEDTSEIFRKAQRHLARRDTTLKQLIKAFGPCTLRHSPDRLGALVRSIIAQQISTKAAAAITGRLEQAVGPRGITATRILKMSERTLRQAGLSANKCKSLYDLAQKVHDGTVPLAEIHSLSDEEVIASLVPVRGIGRWTAEMFLIFSLGRMDVLPVDDFGLRAGVRRQYGFKELPVRKQLEALAEPWRPFRSIGTWYIWRSFGPVRQSEG